MKTSIIILIDINGFVKNIESEKPEDNANYLSTYYKYIADNITPLHWRIIKTMGDSVLISSEINNTPKDIEQLHKSILREYIVSLFYRECDVIEKKVIINNYSCLDIFGHNINNLFLNDFLTIKLSPSQK